MGGSRPTLPMAFLDRDGVLNEDSGYAYRPDQIVWIAGAFAAIRRLNREGYRVVVVTNQSGVARGFYSEDDVRLLHDWMAQRMAEAGAHMDGFYACPYHPDGTVARYRADHEDRKPKPGMLLRAMRDFPTLRERSLMIGDRQSDLDAAGAAGVAGFLFAGGDLDAFTAACLAKLSLPMGGL